MYNRIRSHGLSPRVRGSLILFEEQVFNERSIPASAGQPSAMGRSSRRIAVYPRECGAAFWFAGHNRSAAGLSPRVRGSQLIDKH